MVNPFYLRSLPYRARAFRPSHLHQAVRHKFSARAATGRPRPNNVWGLGDTPPARTRFAPSPTGYLHIGSLRTALYNYLLAKATGGQFLLRLEDTDQNRIVPNAERRLYEDLTWAGLTWDEGPDIGGPYGAYRQSERLDLYRKHINQLLDHGSAYRCFCHPDDVAAMQKNLLQDGRPMLYNGACSHISPDESARRAANGETHCVRFKYEYPPNAQDINYGSVPDRGDAGDFVILKQDGYPTYHFANVVDDHYMKITHVIRGAEWLISTPRHVALYNALGWSYPLYAHVGLLVDANGQKLSKRNDDINLESWKKKGYLPSAVLNYVMLLGWNPKWDKSRKDVMDMEGMVNKFHLKFTKGNIMVNSKDKHLQVNHMLRLVKSLDPDGFLERFLPGIEAYIKSVEDERIGHAADPKDSTPMKGIIGPMVSLARPKEGSDERFARDYLKKVFVVDQKAYKQPDTYVFRHKYFLWQVPESVYAQSLQEEMDRVKFICRRKVVVQQDADGQPEEVKEEIRHYPTELTTMLKDLLLGIDEADWSKSHFEARVAPFLTGIFDMEKGKDSYGFWGYSLLRWILAGLQSGPTAFPMMELLGKEEVMRRVDQALDIAQRWEKSRVITKVDQGRGRERR